MKKLLLLFALSILSLQFYSCSTDYDGPDPANQTPIINVYDTSDITSSKKTKVQWYGNDVDGTKLTFYYTVTTDTTVNITNVFSSMPADGLDLDGNKFWSTTDKNYAYISMPYSEYHSSVCYQDSIPYAYDGADTVIFKAVYSKFFVYGVDELGKKTEMTSKIFKRTNRIPKFPMVFSSKLALNGFDKYWMTVGPDSAQMVLETATTFWKPFDFKWMGEDPDGTDVDLEFKWELYERTTTGDILVTKSAGWSVNNLSKSFDDEIFNHNKQGKYAFKVFVRDDAFEQSTYPSTVNFEVFAPEFTKGILLIDDTDPIMSPPPTSYLNVGNPNASNVRTFYEGLLQYAGYKPEGQATDSLELYRIKKFSKGLEIVGYDTTYVDDDEDPATPEVIDTITPITRGFYDPSIRELTKYRLVIIASDDRSNKNGVDFAGEPPYTGYNSYLASYLDVGGNVFLLGSSVLMGKLYSSPDQLPINNYIAPFRQIFDPYAPVVATLSSGTKDFFNDYFGIYSMTFPEQKTLITYNMDGTISTTQFAQDKNSDLQADNYDFVGLSVYEHITDASIKSLKIDSTKVKEAWYNFISGIAPNQKLLDLKLKDGGTVFTGIPTLEAFKGEVVYKYKSIYDLDRLASNDSIVYEVNDNDTIFHSLWWDDPRVGRGEGPITRRTGTVATRYVSEGDVFRTAFFGLPTYFLDNSDGQVNDMFKTMIEWFELNNDGGSK